MRFLYASFISGAMQYSGILKKVVGQTSGMAQLGYEADYTYVDNDNVILNSNGKITQKPVSKGTRWRDRQKAVADRICEYIQIGNYDYVYIKGFLTSPYDLQIAKCAKASKKSCKVFFEIATFPYWGEYRRFLRVDLQKRNMRSLLGHILEITHHIFTIPRLRRTIDAVVIFGKPVQKLWNVPAITVDNGVSVSTIKINRCIFPEPNADINLLGVVGTSVAHGYSRILDGLAEYEQNTQKGEPKIFFNIVGQNETIQDLKSQAHKLHVENSTRFLGYKQSDELLKMYETNDAAVSCLSEYKVGLNHLSPLKSREYCAAGVPFIYAYEDLLLDESTPFALKLPNNATPVDMKKVVEFVRNCRKNPNIMEQERQFAKQHYDWKVIMKQIIDFAEST